MKFLKYFFIVSLITLILSCARAEWIKVRGDGGDLLQRPFLVMKGPKETKGFFGELEKGLMRELIKNDVRPTFARLDDEPAGGEKNWVMAQCKQIRCERIVLLFMSTKDEAPDSLTIKETPDIFYSLSSRIINPKTGNLQWEGQIELNPSQIGGVELTQSIYSEKVAVEMIENWKKDKLIK